MSSDVDPWKCVELTLLTHACVLKNFRPCVQTQQIRERLNGAGDSSDDLQFDFSDFEIKQAKKVRGPSQRHPLGLFKRRGNVF